MSRVPEGGPPRSARGRILGVDAARAVALLGMFATHILPLQAATGGPTLTGLLADGRSSALFAVLAGVGVALSTGGRRPPADGRAHLAAACGLLVRGVLVGVLGLGLVWFRSPVAVILAYYGLLFVVAAPLLRLRAGPLAALAAACCVLAPLCSQALRIGLPAGPGDQPGLAALGDPGQLLLTLALTGYYPVLPWTTYVLAGMAVGRLDLGRLRAALGLLLGGAVLAAAAAVGSWLLLGPGGGAAVLGADALAQRRYGTTPTDSWWWLAVAAPHSGTPFDLAHTTGTALAVLGGMLLLARGSRGLVWVPAAVGAVPLTLYTTHVIALSLHEPGEDAADPARLQLWLVHVLAAVVIGVLLRLLGRSGPLEAVVSAAGRAVRRSVSRRPGPGTGADPPTTPLPTVTRPGDPGPGGPGPGTTRLPAIPQQAAAPGRVGPVGQLPPRAS